MEQKKIQQPAVRDDVIVPGQLPLQVNDDKEKEDVDVAEQAFQQAVGRIMSALTEGKFKDARFALQEARAIRPDEPVLIDLAGQIASKELSVRLARLREKSVISERQEKWQQAVDICRQALALSPSAAFATACLGRAQRRLDLDKRLQQLQAAGMLNQDDPLTCIKKEAEEETGYKIDEPIKLFELYSSPGAVTEKIHYFIAVYYDAMKISDGGGLEEETEEIEVLEIDFKNAFSMVLTGEIIDAKTVLLLQYLKMNKLL